MRVFYFILVATIFGTGFLNAVQARTWPNVSDPARMDLNYEYHFAALPLKGKLSAEQTPWSETYWPRKSGSINIRWNAPGAPGFDYHSPTREELSKMTREQLTQLSPSEKYDLAMGHYDYPLTHEVYKTRAKKDAADWEGLCDGWTASALQFPEPKPVDFTNPDGLVVPFGSSDIKGLMAYYASEYADIASVQVGAFCGVFNGPLCPELNPGAYHVILANEIGLKHEGFGADVESGRQVWNQPVYGFEFQVVGSAFSLTAKKALHIKAKMLYTSELSHSLWNAVNGTDQFQKAVQEVEYVLEMNEKDEITGGRWITHGTHPDNFWKPTQKIVFSGEFDGLNKIYQP